MAEPQGLSVCDVEPLAPVLQPTTTSWLDGDVGTGVVDAQPSWCDDSVCLQQAANRLAGVHQRAIVVTCPRVVVSQHGQRAADFERGHTARQSHELVRRQVSHRPEREVNGVWGFQDGIHDQHRVILACGGSARFAISPGAHHAKRTRFRRRLKPARPNIWRLSILMRLTCPSTTPELQGRVRPATTASWSRSMPAARVWRPGRLSWRTALSHSGSRWPCRAVRI